MKENLEKEQLPVKFEHTIESDTSYFNSKFPSVGNWVSVQLQPEEFSHDGSNTIDFRPNRIRVTVNVINDAVNAQEKDDSIFVCYYTLGDTNSRERAEGLLNDIYGFYNMSSPD